MVSATGPVQDCLFSLDVLPPHSEAVRDAPVSLPTVGSLMRIDGAARKPSPVPTAYISAKGSNFVALAVRFRNWCLMVRVERS